MATPVRRDVKRGSTVQTKKTGEFEVETRRTFDEDKGASGEHDVSVTSLRKRKRADTQLEILKRHREKNNEEGRQETQETADEEYWLVNIPEKLKFPAPITKEVDKYFLDALDGNNKLADEAFGKSPIRRGSLTYGRRPSDLFARKVHEIITSRKSSLMLDRRSSSASIRNDSLINQSLDTSAKEIVNNNFFLKKSKFNDELRKGSEHEIVFQPPPQVQRNADLNISSDILIDNDSSSEDSSDTESRDSKMTSEVKIPTPAKKQNPKVLTTQNSKESDQLKNSVQFHESIINRFKDVEHSPRSNFNRESQILKESAVLRESQRFKDNSLNPMRESQNSLRLKDPEPQIMLSESFELRASSKKNIKSEINLSQHERNKSQHEKTLSIFDKNSHHERKVSQIDKTPNRHERKPSHQVEKPAPLHSKNASVNMKSQSVQNKTGSFREKSPMNNEKTPNKYEYALLSSQKSIQNQELLVQNESDDEDDERKAGYGTILNGGGLHSDTVSSHEIIENLESERQNLATETDQLDL
jgi:hypothetical protein